MEPLKRGRSLASGGDAFQVCVTCQLDTQSGSFQISQTLIQVLYWLTVSNTYFAQWFAGFTCPPASKIGSYRFLGRAAAAPARARHAARSGTATAAARPRRAAAAGPAARSTAARAARAAAVLGAVAAVAARAAEDESGAESEQSEEFARSGHGSGCRGRELRRALSALSLPRPRRNSPPRRPERVHSQPCGSVSDWGQ